MKQSSKVPEADIQYTPPPKEEMINPIQNVADGLSEVQEGALQSSGFVHNVSGWRLRDNGTAEFQKLIVGTKSVAVSQGQSIQNAINDLASGGGGTILLGAGTHLVSSNIIFPAKTPIQIHGENTSSTIIDFQSVSSNRMILAGTNIYTTGTVSITSGVEVTGVSTNWATSGLVAGDSIFLDSRWYKIGAMAGNTTLYLAEGYGGTALSGASYRAGSIVEDIELKEFTIKNSTASTGAIDEDDTRSVFIEDVYMISCNKGLVVTNISEHLTERCLIASSTSDGATFTTGAFVTNKQLITTSNGGHGLVGNSVKVLTAEFSSSTANTSDGYNITSCTDTNLSVQASGNGSNGIELVSGNDNVLIADGLISGNTSDGIKLTATSDNCRISTSKITYNGGYGVNIAASTCDNNIVVTSIFSNNTSGNLSDSGTGTLVRGNIGIPDNSSIFFGDGSDGSVTFDGSTTILGLAPSSSIYTLTRDIFCINATVNNGVTIKTAGFRIFCNGKLTNAGTITVPGGTGATGGTGGGGAGTTAGGTAAHTGKSCPDTVAGSVGSGGGKIFDGPVAGGNGLASTRGVGSAGGAGGAGVGGTAAGTAGAISGTAMNVPRSATAAYYMFDMPTPTTVQQLGGSAGSGGGSGATYPDSRDGNGGDGGGGGAPGGFIVIFAKEIVNSGTITSPGGNGGTGGVGGNTGTAGGYGGGGGGGGGAGSGGVVILVYSILTNTGTISAPAGSVGAGGAGGTGPAGSRGSGASGGAGVAGKIIYIAST